MTLLSYPALLARELRTRTVRRVLSLRLQARNPTLLCDPTAIWDYAFDHIDAITLGENVVVQAFAEIVVYKHSHRSAVPGRLILGNRSVLAAGVNIRAAGGTIQIGHSSGIGQHGVVVAANHSIIPGQEHLYSDWDESRTGVIIGDNVWVSAQCVLLPGITIGNNSVIAAGSVVTRDVPAGEIWGGIPARKIREIAVSP